MEEAQVASVADHTAGYWNPAGLGLVKEHPSIGLMHAEYFSGIGKYDYAAAAIPAANGKNTFGISLLRFAVDDIPNTLFLVEPDGSLNYNNIQSFSSADYALLLSLGHSLTDSDDEFFGIGGNAKIIYRQVGSFAKAFGFGFDAGAMYHKNGWRFGVNIKDVTGAFQ
ncbi:MAG: PorV/PorQ family protein [Chitinophagaceae bacterium]|nr:PorV/PorQ family protein [Chitinophagaceae bacterium]